MHERRERRKTSARKPEFRRHYTEIDVFAPEYRKICKYERYYERRPAEKPAKEITYYDADAADSPVDVREQKKRGQKQCRHYQKERHQLIYEKRRLGHRVDAALIGVGARPPPRLAGLHGASAARRTLSAALNGRIPAFFRVFFVRHFIFVLPVCIGQADRRIFCRPIRNTITVLYSIPLIGAFCNRKNNIRSDIAPQRRND